MCALLEQQSRAMRDEHAGSISRMTREERWDVYSQRNDRLQQLGKELADLSA